MIINIGKHKGKIVELVTLKDPSYVEWVLSQHSASGSLADIKEYMIDLIEIFDKKPIIRQCKSGCGKMATRFTFYKDNVVNPYVWCDECDPREFVLEGKNSTIISTYREALNYVDFEAGGVKSAKKAIIRTIALLKGLPKRVGEDEAEEFFVEPVTYTVYDNATGEFKTITK